jgi:hypothetical protein
MNQNELNNWLYRNDIGDAKRIVADHYINVRNERPEYAEGLLFALSIFGYDTDSLRR